MNYMQGVCLSFHGALDALGYKCEVDNMVKISVIIPIYNSERYLEECLASIVGQSYQNIEIICIDDGSTDGSASILERFKKNDERVRIVRQENSGAATARNNGISHATGDYCIFVDADDWIEENTCDEINRIIQTTQYDVVLFDYYKEKKNGREARHLYENACEFDAFSINELQMRAIGLSNEWLHRPQDLEILSPLWTKAYKVELLRRQGVFMKKMKCGEDTFFNIEYLGCCKSACYTRKIFYHYRSNEESVTRTYKADCFENFKTLYQYIDSYITNKKLDARYEEALNNRKAVNVIGIGLNEINNPDGLTAIKKKIGSLLDVYTPELCALETRRMPIWWKIMFRVCKSRWTFGYVVLLKAISMLRERRR